MKLTIPFYLHKAGAGFPSPATDYIEEDIDLNVHLIKNVPATFVIRVQGKSMTDASLSDNGFLLPIGGAKGYGLALIFGILAGTLNGAAFGKDVIDMNADKSSSTNTGQFIIGSMVSIKILQLNYITYCIQAPSPSSTRHLRIFVRLQQSKIFAVVFCHGRKYDRFCWHVNTDGKCFSCKKEFYVAFAE